MPPKHFPSKIDPWLLAVLLFCPVSPFITDVILLFQGRGAAPGLEGRFLVALGAATALVLIVWPVDYTLLPQGLLVRSGRFKKRIPYGDILAVRRVRSLRSAPALSIQRLELKLADGARLMISPRDQEGFLRELALRGAGRTTPTGILRSRCG